MSNTDKEKNTNTNRESRGKEETSLNIKKTLSVRTAEHLFNSEFIDLAPFTERRVLGSLPVREAK